MADKTINAAAVNASNLAVIRKEFPAGEAITAGQFVHLSNVNRWFLGSSQNANSANLSLQRGIALHNSAANQPLAVVVSDPNFAPGFSPANSELILASYNTGAVHNVAPAASNYGIFLGVAVSTTRINLLPVASNVAA